MNSGDRPGAGEGRRVVLAPGLLHRLDRLPRRVAVLCASRLGDFLCATPAFRALKTAMPEAHFTLIGMPFVRDLVRRSRHLDAFAEFPGFPGMAEQFFTAKTALRFFERMQRRKFDLAVQLHGSGMYSNIAALMLGARSTAGFVRSSRDAGLLDAALPWPASLHAAGRSLALAVFLGARPAGEATELELFQSDRDVADALLDGLSSPLIGFHAGSRDQAKIWPEERFAEAGSLLRTLAGGSVVLVGGPEEQAAGERIARAIGSRARSLAGKASVPVMAAVISRLSVLITTDSGPAHMAYALAVPSVTLFGCTDPAEWGPPSRPCHRVLRSPDGLIWSLSVNEVVRTAADSARSSRP